MTTNGSSAGSAPFEKSVAKCPAESAEIARLSIPRRISPAYPRARRASQQARRSFEALQEELRRDDGRVCPGRAVPVDQGERELLIRTDELDAVSLEQCRIRRVCTQRLTIL